MTPAASTLSAWAPPSRASLRPVFLRIAPAIGGSRSFIARGAESVLLKNLLRNRAVLVALGLLLLALIVWFAGPYFAFGNAKPFETVVERLVAILVLVTLYALYVLLRQVRNAQHNQR